MTYIVRQDSQGRPRLVKGPPCCPIEEVTTRRVKLDRQRRDEENGWEKKLCKLRKGPREHTYVSTLKKVARETRCTILDSKRLRVELMVVVDGEGDGEGPRSLVKKRGKERDLASRCDRRSRTIVVSFSLPLDRFCRWSTFLELFYILSNNQRTITTGRGNA